MEDGFRAVTVGIMAVMYVGGEYDIANITGEVSLRISEEDLNDLEEAIKIMKRAREKE